MATSWGLIFTPLLRGTAKADPTAIETTRVIALALSQYARDHAGKYPDGTTSTGVFQKLLDGNYVSDPATFYLFMPGKTQPTGSHLQPGNVCYDVTSGVDDRSPDTLPVVFVTGFRITYRPNGQAVSLVRPFPAYAYSAGAWMAWLSGGNLETVDGLAVANKAGEARFSPGQVGRDGYGFVTGILPIDFDSHGAVYRQLTPTGSP